MQDLEKIKNQLRSLKQNTGKTEEEITLLAQQKLDEENILDELSFCINDAERKYAKNLLDKYLSQSSFENFADRDTLGQLVHLEILLERTKSYLKREYDKANPALPTQMMQQLQFLNEQALKLKEVLGLSSADKNQQTWLEQWEKLKKKALNYYETHKGCNVVKCPYCSKIFYLLLRTDQLTSEKCEWFKGTALYNRALMKLIDQKVLTQEQVAEIMGVNVLYIEKIYNNIYLKDKLDDRKD